MSFNQVLVVYKRSEYQMHRQGIRKPPIRELCRLNQRKVELLKKCHEEHLGVIEFVKHCLGKYGLNFTVVDRHDLKTTTPYDLIITIGGDGTVLRTSHLVGDAPVLGVNSFPKSSTGFFCAATRRTFEKWLVSILDGRVFPKPISRLEVLLNGKLVKELVLNEVLFASSMVAATTKYILKVGRGREEQRSSGVWISTAAGSTAVIRSAGGRVLPILSKKIQYLVREPCTGKRKRFRYVKGVLEPPQSIGIVSEISSGYIYIDGPKIAYPAPIGAEVVVRGGDKPLLMYL